MIFRKEKVKDLPPMIFLLIFDFWAGTVCKALAAPTNILYLVTSKYAIFFVPHIVFRGWKVFLINLYPPNTVRRIAGNKRWPNLYLCKSAKKKILWQFDFPSNIWNRDCINVSNLFLNIAICWRKCETK